MHDFWAFLEAGQLSDDCLAEGYEQAGSQLRGHLKKNIAVHHELLEQRLPPEFKHTEISYGATVCAKTTVPAPWCLIVHEASYSAAPRALAAAMPAQLAGVPLTWSIALREKNAPAAIPPAPVLAAWELAGIENVATVDLDSFMPRLRQFMASPECAAQGPGRVLILGAPGWNREICAICDERNALLRREGPAPRILLTGDLSASYHELISALHPDADLRLAGKNEAALQNADRGYAAVFTPKASASLTHSSALHMDYAHCGCWIWPGMDAAFFLNHNFSLCGKL